MKKTIICLIMLITISFSLACEMNVVFINPGNSNETFWVMVSNFMEAAANDLDIELEIIYAERDFLQMPVIAKEVANRPNKPDYFLIVNEKLIAPQLIDIGESSGIKTFVILNGLTDEQVKNTGRPRELFSSYLGSLIPDNTQAGYMIGKSLVKEASKFKSGTLNIAAINGNRATPASVFRAQGLNKAVSESNAKIMQMTYAEWNQETAYKQALGLLKRYKDLDIIWTANDPMALGAVKAAKESGRILGKDLFIGGLNWSTEALEAIDKNELVATIGGHFMVGGWSIVLLYDYHNGSDFKVIEGGTELKINIFGIIDKSNSDNYIKYFGDQNWEKIEFSKFSLIKNRSINKYNFSLEKILEQF